MARIVGRAEITFTDYTDVTAIVTWYTATAGAQPVKPTTTVASAQPTGWSRSEPTVASEQDLSAFVYTCMQLVWGDGTCSWGDVVLSSTYEAAKVVYNQAAAAATLASEVETELGKVKVWAEESLPTIEYMEQAIEDASGLTYDHTYAKVDTTYVFAARLTKGGQDVTAEYDRDRFVWYLRNEDGDVLWARGPTMAIDEADVDYRTSIIGGFEDEGAMMDTRLVDHSGNPIVTSDGEPVIARTIWEDE